MSPPPITPHIPQPPNILPHLPLRIILDRHVRQLGRQLRDGALGDVADACLRVDAEFCEQPRAGLRAERVEGLEGDGDHLRFGEVDAEEENLGGKLAVLYCTIFWSWGGRGGIGGLRLGSLGYRGAYHCERCRGVFARLRVRGIGIGDNRRSFLLRGRSESIEPQETFRLPRFCRTDHSRIALRVTCTSSHPCQHANRTPM